MGLDMDAQRQAALAGHASTYGIWQDALGDVFRLMTDDEERARQIRIYGTVTPSDIRSAWSEVLERRTRQEAREHEQRASVQRTEAWAGSSKHAYVPPPPGEGKADNLRRLKEGTLYAPPGTPENRAQWDEYYRRDYVKEAQELARERLADYSQYKIDEEERL